MNSQKISIEKEKYSLYVYLIQNRLFEKDSTPNYYHFLKQCPNNILDTVLKCAIKTSKIDILLLTERYLLIFPEQYDYCMTKIDSTLAEIFSIVKSFDDFARLIASVDHLCTNLAQKKLEKLLKEAFLDLIVYF